MVALLLKGWVGRLRWDCQRDPGEPPEMEASAKMSMFLESQGLSIKKYRGRSCSRLVVGCLLQQLISLSCRRLNNNELTAIPSLGPAASSVRSLHL